MGFSSEDIKINKAKSELELIKSILDSRLGDASNVAAESSKVVDTLSFNISKAEELTDGFGDQVQEIQGVLNGFRLYKDCGPEEMRREYRCSECPEVFPYPNLLDIHMKLHRIRYSCDVCGKKYQKLAFLEKHKLYDHKNTYDCRWCSRTFSTYQSLRIHENLTHENPVKLRSRKNGCTNCSVDFPTPEELEKHMESCAKIITRASYSVGPSPSYNPVISPALSVRSLPNLRRLTPNGKITSPQITLTKLDLTCPFCSRDPFATTTSRDRHIKRFHMNMTHMLTNSNFHATKSRSKPEPKTGHTCIYCGRSFPDSSRLNAHVNTHKRNDEAGLADVVF